MKKIKLLSLVLAFVLMFTVALGCDGGNGGEVDDTAGFGVNDPDEDAKTFDKYPTVENPDISVIYFTDPNAYEIKKAQNPNYFDAVLEAIPEFEKKYGGKVTVIYKAWNDMQQHLTDLVNASEAPDLAVVYDRSLHPYIESQTIQNISPYVGELDYSFWDVNSDLFSWNNKLYGIPIRPFPFYCVFNRDLFETNGVEAPDVLWKKGEWTFDKFEEVCKKVTRYENGELLQFGFGSYTDSMGSFMLANGGGALLDFDYKDAKVKNGMKTNKVKTTLDYLSRWVKQPGGIMAFNSDDFDVGDSFESGEVGIIRLYEYPVTDFKPSFETGIVPFPTGPEYAGKKISVTFPQAFAVPTGAKNAQGAVAFLYMVNQIQATTGADFDKKRFGEEYYNMLFGDDVMNLYAYDKGPSDMDHIIATMNNLLFDNVPPVTIVDTLDSQIIAAIEKTWGANALE